MIELTESQAAFLTLLERLPAEHTITQPTVAPAKPKSRRGVVVN
ncbi:hypothetical protein [Aeromonas sp. MR16]|nr:hypothetical protein [Aeromonas sp. MR16]